MYLGVAAVVLRVGGHRALVPAALFALIAYLHGRLLAWRFVVDSDGVTIRFPFGRELFLPRAAVTIETDMVGTVVRVRGRLARYLLLDGILYRPGQEDRLRRAFEQSGFTLVK